MTLSRLAADTRLWPLPLLRRLRLLLWTGQVLISSLKISFRMCHPFGMNAASFRFLRARAESNGGNAGFQNRVLIAFRNSQENFLRKSLRVRLRTFVSKKIYAQKIHDCAKISY